MGYTEKFESWYPSSNGNWEVKDLSGDPFYVPANAVCEIVMANTNASSENSAGVRAYGSLIDRFLELGEAEGGGINTVRMHVQADSNSRIETYGTWQVYPNELHFYLVGYYDSGSYVEISPALYETAPNDAQWDVKNLDYGTASKIHEIALANLWGGAAYVMGIRAKDSSLERKWSIHECESNGVSFLTVFVELDANKDCEVYAENNASNRTRFIYLGYWDIPPGTWTEKYQPVNAFLSDQWIGEDLSSYITDGAVVEMVGANGADAANHYLGVRETNSGNDRRLLLDEAEGGGQNHWSCHVNSDSSGNVELYEDDLSGTPPDVHYIAGQWVMEEEGVTVTPAPASAVATAVIGAVVLGSVSITPAPVAAVTASIDPTVVLGSLSLTPNPVEATGVTVDPTVILGSLSITPEPAAAEGATVDPTVILSSMAVAPDPAVAVAATVDCVVVLGSLILTPDPAGAVAAVVDPTVIAGGDILVSPGPASAIGATVNPTIILGATSVTPAPASAIGATVQPTVVLGSLTLSPDPAAAMAAAVDPGVILGSIMISPDPSAAIGATVDPTVILGSIMISPNPSSAVADRANPTVVLGTISFTPDPASSVAAVIDPTVVISGGEVIVTPDPAYAIAGAIDPAVRLGSVTISPGPSNSVAGKMDPTVVLGSLSVTPDPSSAVADRANPIVILGSIVCTPAPASAVGAVVDPAVKLRVVAKRLGYTMKTLSW